MFLIEFTWWNILTILVAVVASQIVGAIWYSETFGFGKKWMALVGITDQMKQTNIFKKKMIRGMVIGIVCAFATSYVFFILIDDFILFNTLQAVLLAVFVWLGFSGSALAMNYAYNPRLTLRLFLIDAGHHLLSLISMAVVLSIMIFR